MHSAPFFELSPILRVLGSVSGLKPPKTGQKKPKNFENFPFFTPPFTDAARCFTTHLEARVRPGAGSSSGEELLRTDAPGSF